MPKPDEQRIIDEARRSFDAALQTPEFDREHADDAQLGLLLDYLAVRPGGRYLDLATGNGYAAFAIAERQPDCRVTGIDIADRAIARNIERAREKGLANADFAVMDGVRLGVPAGAFDGIVCRYALHHMPDLRRTLGDARAALAGAGRLVIADPVRDDGDDGDFINRFQALKPDGHVRFHTRDGLLALFGECGFRPWASAMTSISYRRALTPDYRALIGATPRAVLEAYGIAPQGDEVSARLDILNAAFVGA